MSLWVERTLDDRSTGSAAQQDIQAFYDTIDVARCAAYLQAAGAPQGLAGSVLRHQMRPQMWLTLAGRADQLELPPKGSGAIMGSRVAGALGRIPVEHMLMQLAPSWRTRGVQITGATLTMAVYVDKLFVVAKSAADCVHMLCKAEAFLMLHWHLAIKPSSLQILVVKGSPEDKGIGSAAEWNGWRMTRHMRVSGHVISGVGSCLACRREAQRAIWRSFWQNCGSKRAK